MAVAPRDPVTAYVALGANLGDAQAKLQQAFASIAALPGVRELARSPLYASAPVDSSGPDYVNAVMGVSTILSAPALLACLQALEQQAGRTRPYRNAPRTLDLDLLLYGEGRMDSPRLTLPHPRMRERAFVLRPLADIAQQLVGADELAACSAQLCTKI